MSHHISKGATSSLSMRLPASQWATSSLSMSHHTSKWASSHLNELPHLYISHLISQCAISWMKWPLSGLSLYEKCWRYLNWWAVSLAFNLRTRFCSSSPLPWLTSWQFGNLPPAIQEQYPPPPTPTHPLSVLVERRIVYCNSLQL